jgi:chromate transporter
LQIAPPMNDTEAAPAQGPTALKLFAIFARIGLTSFGGGLSGWLFRTFVQDYRWLTEEEFLNGLSIAQALPGVNVSNMAVWIGYRLRGSIGAFASLAGIIVPPAIVIVLLGAVFTSLQRFDLTHIALTGAGAAAIGLSLVMGITAARRVPRRALPIAVMIVTFVAVAIIRVPLIWVVLVGSPISVALAARTPR